MQTHERSGPAWFTSVARTERYKQVLAAMVDAKRRKDQEAYDDAHWQMVWMLMGRDRGLSPTEEKDDTAPVCSGVPVEAASLLNLEGQ